MSAEPLQSERLQLNYSNRKITMGIKNDGSAILKSWGEVWLDHSERRQYEGVIFDPTNTTGEDYLNLWRGFSVAPVHGEWSKLRQHIKQVICNDDNDCYHYLLNWMAHLVQHPEILPEVAIVMQGEEEAARAGIGRIVPQQADTAR